ncbi:MAG: protein phosphatase 2C domain-containing protein [Rhodobacteraceae bacterium]|jgi:protein phosphatase|nr:protein phosphatase 2C domain-containing protein [Paracoccaceae bacterium]
MPVAERARALTVATAAVLERGARDHQEDALATGALPDGEAAFAVLADGMGGHSAGDVASRLVVETVTAAITGWMEAPPGPGRADIGAVLRAAAAAANDALRAHASAHPATRGMGATLLVAFVDGSRLWWLSVGDSPLWLWRDGRLHRMNEVHSLAPQIDLMVEAGLMDAETARTHPDRSCLTSVIHGQDIARIDCPERPVDLQAGDVVLAASDGVEFLGRAGIAAVLAEGADAGPDKIAEGIAAALHRLADPDQDNAALAVLSVHAGGMRAIPVPSAPPQAVSARPPTRNLWPFAARRSILGRLGPHKD